MPSSTTAYLPWSTRKPVGGFVFLTVQQLCLLWWVYHNRHIRLMDFRVWFAAHEMLARRCQIDAVQVPDYTLPELHGLVGGTGGAPLRASLLRLEGLRLLTWSSNALTFATSPADLRGIEDLSDFFTMHQAITNNRRRVPVPRQAVRLIAGGLKTSVIATMLGHLIRCLYYRDQHCRSGGWCKASWIAEVFGLNLRSVKAARKHLVEVGWLQTFPTPQRLCNRWGPYLRINLSWTRVALEQAPTDSPVSPSSASPPPAELCTTGLPPLSKEHQKPFQEFIHQEPAPQAEAALSALPPHPAALPSSGNTGVETQDKNTTKLHPLPATLQHLVPEDLRDTARLLDLFQQAQQQGLIGKSDSARLTFVAAAEHACIMGASNPCGLFATLIRHQLWHYVTDRDEDAASARLKQHWYGRASPRRPVPPPGSLAPHPLSKDAFMIRELQRELARAGFQGEAFGWVHRLYPEWTRARWDHAVAELTTAQQGWQRANAGISLEACVQVFGTPWAA
jgi:hypothetical protein